MKTVPKEKEKIKNNYAPSNVRTIGSIFEFDPATECDYLSSFAIGEKYIEIGRVTYAVAI